MSGDSAVVFCDTESGVIVVGFEFMVKTGHPVLGSAAMT